jgi:putative oxidoreductase
MLPGESRLGKPAGNSRVSTHTMDATRNLALLAGRICLAGLVIYDASLMVRSWEQTAAYMAGYGVPTLLLPFAALFQFVGGVFLVLGHWTRPTALAFAGFAVTTALIFHLPDGNAVQVGKDFAIAGGFLVLAAAGAGRWSADAYREGRG